MNLRKSLFSKSSFRNFSFTKITTLFLILQFSSTAFGTTSESWIDSSLSGGQVKVHSAPMGSSTALLFIHGLGEDSQQLALLEASAFNQGFTTLTVNLSGHGSDQGKASQVTYKSWLTDLEFALNEARNWADELIVVGHSTGGMLALISAVTQPNFVGGLVLIEPALRVRPLSHFAICRLHDLGVQSTQTLGHWGQLIDKWGWIVRPQTKGIHAGMGCQVNSLRGSLSALLEVDHFSQNNQTRAYAHEVKVPTLVVNNPRDMITSFYHTELFVRELHHAHYHVIDDKIPHGQVLDDPQRVLELTQLLTAYLQQQFLM